MQILVKFTHPIKVVTGQTGPNTGSVSEGVITADNAWTANIAECSVIKFSCAIIKVLQDYVLLL